MSMQRWGLALGLSLGLCLAGCGDDDAAATNGKEDGGTSDGSGGSKSTGGKTGKDAGDGQTSTGKAGNGGSSSGTGGDDSAGSSGSGGSDSNGGSGGSGAGSDVSDPSMCDVMQMTGMGTDNCTGEEEYAKCVTDKCDYFSCYNSDACADQKDCFESSDDPCNADCMQSDDCTQCYLDKQPCVYDCLPLVTCDGMQLMPPPGAGMTEEGGGCDQLDDCWTRSPIPISDPFAR